MSVIMKSYPTIEYRINRNVTVTAFDKLDGSNIRAEWSAKNGFHKFGARTRLLDPAERPLGEAIDLINEKYSESLSKAFYDNKYGRALAFFELWGPNSFAGNHEDEKHTVTLIDVNPYKRGILPHMEFRKLFDGYIDIPNILFTGRIGIPFIEAVRNSTLENMTFEGVVCKGVGKKGLVMFKIKSKAWITKVKDAYGHDSELLDRTELIVEDSKKYRQRRFCPMCFRNGSLSPTCRCGAVTLGMSFDAQPPRKRASKTRWRKFFQEWYPDLDFNFHWRNR
jgi:hypothetical protein